MNIPQDQAARIPEDASCTCPPGALTASCPTCRAFGLLHAEIEQRQQDDELHMHPPAARVLQTLQQIAGRSRSEDAPQKSPRLPALSMYRRGATLAALLAPIRFPAFGLASAPEHDDTEPAGLTAPYLLGLHCTQPHNLRLPAEDAGGGGSPENVGALPPQERLFCARRTDTPTAPVMAALAGVPPGTPVPTFRSSNLAQGCRPRLEARAAVFNRNVGAVHMAGDSLRASAPTAAPTEGTTSFPSSFAFRVSGVGATPGGYYAEADEPDAGRFFSISGAAGGRVHLFHGTAGMSGTLELRAEQARAVGAELIAAADAVQGGPVELPSGAAALLSDLQQASRTFDAIASLLEQDTAAGDVAAARLRGAARHLAKWSPTRAASASNTAGA